MSIDNCTDKKDSVTFRQIFTILCDCMKQYIGITVLFLLMLFFNVAIFYLYDIPSEPILYTAVLLSALCLFYMVYLFGRAIHRALRRKRLLAAFCHDRQSLPPPKSLAEREYQTALLAMAKQIDIDRNLVIQEKTDMTDYYTAWVHQIKTPIAVMRMILADEDTDNSRTLSGELFRIEEYVNMVLEYIRLESDSNDLVIREYPLDTLIRQSIRKYAFQFVKKRLSLDYQPTDFKIVTDEKWLTVIIEQLLSNAIKYTVKGGIRIYMTNENVLVIEDSGIGIAAEDLPRIFEKGYTGYNGRIGQKSSGLGLYLCKRAADKLSIPLSAESEVGKGSRFLLHLNQSDGFFIE